MILRSPRRCGKRNSIAIGLLADKMTGYLGLQHGNLQVSCRQGTSLPSWSLDASGLGEGSKGQRIPGVAVGLLDMAEPPRAILKWGREPWLAPPRVRWQLPAAPRIRQERRAVTRADEYRHKGADRP